MHTLNYTEAFLGRIKVIVKQGTAHAHFIWSEMELHICL